MRYFLFFVSLYFFSCTQPQKEQIHSPNQVEIVGAMRDVMWKGELGSKINLDTLSKGEGLIALAPESYLRGEIMILDGESYISRVSSDTTMIVTKGFESGAPFMVYSRVNEWKAISPASQFRDIKEVEQFLKEVVVDRSKPFPFKIEGRIRSAVIHVQNLADGSKVSSPEEAHEGQVNYSIKDQEVKVAGFYSESHQGVFTHHDSYTHMHLINSDESMMGHLDEVDFESLEIYFPEYLTVNEYSPKSKVELIVLGTVQDAGSPQIGCKKKCCVKLFEEPDKNRKVVSLGLLDHESGQKFLFEATPDIATQLKFLKQSKDDSELPDAIFLTHAHIGHYSGLMYLGREATNADSIVVYSMPRMKSFLENNGPWNQLVALNNIHLNEIKEDSAIQLTDNIKLTPLLVPHRDEYSETVGYLIEGQKRKAVFIPDIDKWGKWDQDIKQLINEVDYAFLDATFYDGSEVGNRDISEIPHPFVVESMELFQDLSAEEKQKIHFIHFNHTNPLLDINSAEYKKVNESGFRVSKLEDRFEL